MKGTPLVHVVATAGHVNHGKSSLVSALTGMEPDRWAEERRRGLTIDLGFAWLQLPSGEQLAIVDVPGHERFVPNMLAGVGPIPAVMFVVAADEGWKPQSEEHLAALDAFGVQHGVLVISRCDLAPPDRALEQARQRLAGTSLADVPAVAVSAGTGDGMDTLLAELGRIADALPPADSAAAVRLWVDRSFAIKGAGTVVTGTLPAGTVRAGDELILSRTGRLVRVRTLQALGEEVSAATGVSRVALNLRGVDRHELKRGDALVSKDSWPATEVVDVRVRAAVDSLPAQPISLPTQTMLHVGSAAVSVTLRTLGEHTARLRLRAALPLAVGDRGLLRDPGQHRVVAGVTVLDPDPAPLRGRGAASRRGAELETMTAQERSREELRRRRFMTGAELARRGLAPVTTPAADGWYVDPDTWASLPNALADAVRAWQRARPLEAGLPVEAARQQLGVPARMLVEAAAQRAGLRIDNGRVLAHSDDELPAQVGAAIAELDARWETEPFVAPDAQELRRLGLGAKEIAAAARAGRLLRIAEGVVLPPEADVRAVDVLSRLAPATFTLSEARQALGTSRRVAVPLMELLDRQGRTRRTTPDTRRLVTDD